MIRLSIILALLLSGCATAPEPIPHVVVAPLGAATTEEIAAKNAWITNLETRLQKKEELAQLASGAVFGALDANELNPEGRPKDAVKVQAEEAAHALPSPTDAQKLEKQAQNTRIMAGELVEVRAEMGQQATEIDSLKGKLTEADKAKAVLEERMSNAEKLAKTERDEAAAKLQRVMDSMSKRVSDAEDAVKNQVRIEQVATLNEWATYCAGAAILSFGLAWLFGNIAGVRKVAPFSAFFLLGALTCFGLAQIVGLWWFKWAVLGSVAIVLALCAWWVFRQHEAGTLKAAAEAKAAKLKDALNILVPVIDKAYNDAEQKVKDVMDATIFKPLNDLMDGKDKATILEIKAELETPKKAA